MTERSRVTSTLNKIADPVFMAALSSHGQAAMSDFIADFSSRDADTDISDSKEEEEPGEWQL